MRKTPGTDVSRAPAAFLVLAAAALGACAGDRPAPAPPEEIYGSARIPGFGRVRFWGDAPQPDQRDRLAELTVQTRARAAREGAMPNRGRLDTLVLSGGGADGPFGAGFLAGWTERGDRPEFAIVTGISAGALIAPFAFLGPDYDDEMERFTVETSDASLVALRILGNLYETVSVFDVSELEARVRALITPELVRRIADEHDKGRRLLVGTTHLDAQRPVYWRIDQIAKEGLGAPERTADLVARILLASAAIPGMFPPRFFVVEAGGERYTEMHVDGGVTHQLFTVPMDVAFEEQLPPDMLDYARRGTIYVIRNTKYEPDYEQIPASAPLIASRAVTTLTKFSGRADVKALSAAALTHRFPVKVAAVPEDFDMVETEMFDPAYMRAIHELGRSIGRSDDPWSIELLPEPEEVRAAAAR